MPRDLLRRIEHVPLPIEVRRPQDIRSAAVLRAAGMLEAIVPPEPFDELSAGTILKITPLGRAELERHAEECDCARGASTAINKAGLKGQS